SASPTLEMGLLAFPEGDFDDFALTGCLLNPAGPNCPAILADGGCNDVATAPHVAIAPLSQNGAAINSWLNQNSATGNTPTWGALKKGYAILLAHQALGQRFALLMTDGEPTLYTPPFGGFPEMFNDCGLEADIENEVLAAANSGITTFVIGSPGSEGAATFLSQLAVNGGTPKDPNCTPGAGNCHYQIGTTNFQQELEAVLQEIAGVISDCIFDVPQGEDIDPNLVNIVIETPSGPVQIYKDPTHQNGWDYTDPTMTKIQLFGPACDLYKEQTGNTITIILGCKTVLR
ncbi:MAG: VWA domain-containing protein, partial [Deltaproteobacteria bacterium]|nr:VWA domain-containing protein [Deltaproteobacteria bacterium]